MMEGLRLALRVLKWLCLGENTENFYLTLTFLESSCDCLLPARVCSTGPVLSIAGQPLPLSLFLQKEKNQNQTSWTITAKGKNIPVLQEEHIVAVFTKKHMQDNTRDVLVLNTSSLCFTFLCKKNPVLSFLMSGAKMFGEEVLDISLSYSATFWWMSYL